MKRIVLFVLGVTGGFDQRVGAGAGRHRQGPARRPGQSARRGDGHQVEARLHLRHVEERHEPSGLLRQVGPARTAAVLVECTSIGNLDRAAQNMKFEAAGDKAQALLDAAEKDGTRVKPEFGSVWYHLMGADKDHTRTHMTIAVPGATTQSIGLPDNNKQGGVWIMNAGTTTAHLMTPGE